MKVGTQVWAAREGADGVEVGEARVVRRHKGVHGEWWVVDRPLLGNYDVHAASLHATRTAALLALSERLEESAREDRRLAAEFTTRAEQRLIQAERAKRMAEEGR